jgi:hypothetical protein
MHVFHNSHLLRATLPQNLVTPIPLFPERQAKHSELAARLHNQAVSRKAAAVARKWKQLEDDANEDAEARPHKS